jgi:hypothetical protein
MAELSGRRVFYELSGRTVASAQVSPTGALTSRENGRDPDNSPTKFRCAPYRRSPHRDGAEPFPPCSEPALSSNLCDCA